MKIGITGATGLVGRACLELARKKNHEVIAFSRNPSAQVTGATETRLFTFDDALNLSGLDALIHLAGESVLGLWTEKKKEAIRESRTGGTRAVVQAMARQSAEERVKVFVCASAIGIYGPAGDAKLTEDSLLGEGFLADVCRAWEAEANRAGELGVRTVTPRIGLVLGKDAPIFRSLPLFKLGLGASFGNGRQWMSWIHLDDVAGMILYAIEEPGAKGAWNATAPNPVRNSEFTDQLAKKAGRRAWMKVPALPLKVLLGDASSIVLEGQRVIPERAREHGYQFEVPELSEAFARSI